MLTLLFSSVDGNASLLIPFLVSIASTGGLTGIVIAVAKLRGDTQTAALSQARGANEAMRETLEAIERERDYWRGRYETEHALLNEAREAMHRASLATDPRPLN